MKKIDEIVDRVLEAQSDYYVANQRGYKVPQDALDDGDQFLYMNMLLQDMARKGKLKFGKWYAQEEDMMGTWAWFEKGNEDKAVYITPFFESEDSINSGWADAEGDYGDLGLTKFTATGDEKKDFANYMKVVKKILSAMK
jgi:hypothetical protein